MDTEDFGTWLVRQLRRAGMSQSDFADRLGVTRAAVSAWVTGRAEPRPERVREIAEIFNVDAAAVRNREEEPLSVRALAWYHRPAHADGGREMGNAAAFAFDVSLGTIVREAVQNSLDEQVDPARPVRVRFTLEEISGERFLRFLHALRWNELGEHYEQAARNPQKVGRVIAEALADMRDFSRLILLRIDDYNASGLTGDDFDDKGGDNRFAAVMRRQLESYKAKSGAGGSFGLGKAALWSASRLGLVLANSTLSVPFEGRRERRMIGRLDLPWRRLDTGEELAGPAWFGEPDPSRTEATRSWWADEATAAELYLARENPEPGTSFLIVGLDDAILENPPEELGGVDPASDTARRTVLRAMHEELRAKIADNFWAAMVSGSTSPALLEASVATRRDGTVVVPEERVLPDTYQPARSKALRAFYDNTTTAELTAEKDVVQASVTLTVPPRKDQRDRRPTPVEHRAVLLLTRASEDDGRAVDRLACMRGNRMEVETRRIGGAQSSGHFTAILLAGYAADHSPEALAAEEFLRAAEPPDHNAWKKTEDLTTVYVRGAAKRLEEFRRDILQAVYNATHLKETASADEGPAYLRELLPLNHPPQPRTSSYPTVRRISGQVDESGAWQVEVDIRVPDRRDPWTFVPVLKFVTQSGPDLPAEWAHLEAESGCQLTGDGVFRCTPGARTAVIRGTSAVASHPVAARMSRATVDLTAAQGTAA